MKKKTLLIFLCRVHGQCSLSSNVPTVDSVESWWLEFEGEILSKCFIGINVNTRTNRCSCSRSVSYYYYNFLSETSRWYPVDIVPLGCTIFYVLKFIFYFYFFINNELATTVGSEFSIYISLQTNAMLASACNTYVHIFFNRMIQSAAAV